MSDTAQRVEKAARDLGKRFRAMLIEKGISTPEALIVIDLLSFLGSDDPLSRRYLVFEDRRFAYTDEVNVIARQLHDELEPSGGLWDLTAAPYRSQIFRISWESAMRGEADA